MVSVALMGAVVLGGFYQKADALTYVSTVSTKLRVPANLTNTAVRTFTMIPLGSISSLSDDPLTSIALTINDGVAGAAITRVALYADGGDSSFSAASDTLLAVDSLAAGDTTISLSGFSHNLSSSTNAQTFFIVIDTKSTAPFDTLVSMNMSAINNAATANTEIDFSISGIYVTPSVTANPTVVIPDTNKVPMLGFSLIAAAEDFQSLVVRVENDKENFDSDGNADGVSAVYVAEDTGITGLFETGTDNIVASVTSGNLTSASAVTLSFETGHDTVTVGDQKLYLVLYDVGSATAIENSANIQCKVARFTGVGLTSGLTYTFEGNDLNNVQVNVGGITYKSLESIVPNVTFGSSSTVPMAKFRLRSEAFSSTINSLTFKNQGSIKYITDPNDTNGITKISIYRDDGDFEFDGIETEVLVTSSALGFGNQSNTLRISNLSVSIPTYNQDAVSTNEVAVFVVYDIGSGVAVTPSAVAGFQILEGSGETDAVDVTLKLSGTLPSEPSATVTLINTNLGYANIVDVSPTTINRGAIYVPMIAGDFTAAINLDNIIFTVANDGGTYSSTGTGVSSVALFRDLNSNNHVDTADVLLVSTANFSSATQVSLPGFSLSQGTHHLILAYDLGPQASLTSLNIRSKISSVTSPSSDVVLSGDLPIPRAGVLSTAIVGLLQVNRVSADVSQVNNLSGTFNVDVEIQNNSAQAVTLSMLYPRFYETTLGGTDLSAEYGFVATFNTPISINASVGSTYNFVVNPVNIRTDASVVADMVLIYEATPTYNVAVRRYSSSSGYVAGSAETDSFEAISTFNARSGDLPSYISTLTVDGRDFRSGNYVKPNARLVLVFTNKGQDIDIRSLKIYLTGTLLHEGQESEGGYTYDPDTGTLVIANLGSSGGTLTLSVNDSQGNALETEVFSFAIDDSLKITGILAFPSPYLPALSGNTLRIGLNASKEGSAQVFIYSVTGTLVQTLNLASMVVGYNEVTWNGIDTSVDRSLPSGIYLIRVIATDLAGNKVYGGSRFAVY